MITKTAEHGDGWEDKGRDDKSEGSKENTVVSRFCETCFREISRFCETPLCPLSNISVHFVFDLVKQKSGSPLVHKNEKRLYQSGITSLSSIIQSDRWSGLCTCQFLSSM